MDETSDNVTDRSVLNLVLTPISASAATDKTASYIGDQVYVDRLDHKIIAAEVMKFEINHNDVIAYYTCQTMCRRRLPFSLVRNIFQLC